MTTTAIKKEVKGSPQEVAKLTANIDQAINDARDYADQETGWIFLGAVRVALGKIMRVDTKLYGFKKFGELIEALDLYDIDKRPASNELPNSFLIYIRKKR